MSNNTNKRRERLNAVLAELQKACVDVCGELTTSVNVYITYQGYTIEIEDHTPESLQNEGISMRNIQGEWIR